MGNNNRCSGKKWIFVLGLVFGFILAAHWDYGRRFVLDYSPLKSNAIESTGTVIKQGADSTVQNMKEKVMK